MQNGAHRRVSQMNTQLYPERSQSPISRTGTPSMHHDPNIAPQHMFDGVALADHVFQTPALPSLGNHPSPGSEHLTYEQLLAQTTMLKTRVSELEVINMMFQDNLNNLSREKDDAVRGQEDLKRRVEELEHQAQMSLVDLDQPHPHKKPRLDVDGGLEQEQHDEEEVNGQSLTENQQV